MCTFPKSVLTWLLLLVLLTGCSMAGPLTSPAPAGTLAPLIIATEAAQVATEIVETVPGIPKTEPAIPTTSTSTPLPSQGAQVAAFGDLVPIGRGGIRDAAFSPDRATLAIGWTNGVSLTNTADLTDLWYWESPAMVTAVDASAGQVAVLLVDGDVWLLEVESGASQRFPEAAKVPGGDAFWGDIAWSPEGRLAAIQAVGGAGIGATPILLLDPVKEEITELPGSLTNPGWVPYLVWSPDSLMIASADQERQGWALDAASGDVVYKPQPDSRGGSTRIYAWMPDSRTVIVGAGGASLRLEDIPTGKVLRRLPGVEVGFVPTPPVVVSPDGALALIGGYALGDYELHPYQVWDLERGQPLEAPPVGELRHVNSAGCMQLNRPAVAFDGEQAITLDTDGRLMDWKVGEEQGEVLGQIPVRYPCLQTPMVWSSDSARVILETDPDQAVTVWDGSSGELVAERKDGTYPADVDGELLAYRGEDGDLILWNMAENAEVGRLPGPVTPFTSGVAFSPDGSQIAYGVGNQLHIAGVTSGETLAVLDGYPEGQEISHIQWAPSGEVLTAASGSIRGFEESPGVLVLWEKVGDAYQEAIRTETVYASADPPWVTLSQFSPSSRLVGLERMPQPEAGQEVVQVFDRGRRTVILEMQTYMLHQWLSDEILLLTQGCRFIAVNVLTGEEQRGSGEGCQAELGAFAPDGVHFSDVVFSGRWVDVINWRTGLVETRAYVGSDLQDGVFSPDGRWLLVRAIEGLVRALPVSYSE